jgi:uncharacterized protein YyaL (SSP411 family)
VDEDPHGEFAGRNILYRAAAADAAEEAEWRRVLLAARVRRPRPQLDDKILTAWNAMMIGALARASRVLAGYDGERAARYGAAAKEAWHFVMCQLYDAESRTLYRRWRNGERAIPAFLDDFAALIAAHLELFESFQEAHFLRLARTLAQEMLARFEDGESGGFYSAPAGEELVLRLKDDYDGAEPAGNSTAALALLRLAEYAPDAVSAGYAEAARRVLRTFAARLNRDPLTLPEMLCAALYERAPKRQIVIAGAEPDALWAVARRRFLPFASIFVNPRSGPLAGMRAEEGPARAYVCENYACQLPVSDAGELERLLGQ